MNLKSRLEKLERITAPASPILNGFVVGVSPDGEREMDRITVGDMAWDRLPGETEDAFKQRVVAEAPPPQPNCIRLFVCSSVNRSKNS